MERAHWPGTGGAGPGRARAHRTGATRRGRAGTARTRPAGHCRVPASPPPDSCSAQWPDERRSAGHPGKGPSRSPATLSAGGRRSRDEMGTRRVLLRRARGGAEPGWWAQAATPMVTHAGWGPRCTRQPRPAPGCTAPREAGVEHRGSPAATPGAPPRQPGPRPHAVTRTRKRTLSDSPARTDAFHKLSRNRKPKTRYTTFKENPT